MKLRNIIFTAALLGGLATSTLRAQTTSCWVIVNGPGAGAELVAVDGVVANPSLGDDGTLALGHFADCECLGHAGHYHGTLSGLKRPGSERLRLGLHRSNPLHRRGRAGHVAQYDQRNRYQPRGVRPAQ